MWRGSGDSPNQQWQKGINLARVDSFLPLLVTSHMTGNQFLSQIELQRSNVLTIELIPSQELILI